MPEENQLILDIKRSKQMLYFLLIIHGMAVFSLLTLSLPLYLIFISILLIGFSLAYYLMYSNDVVRIISLPDNQWHMQKRNGNTFTARFTGDAYSSSWLTLLAFKSDEKIFPTHIILMKDSVAECVLSQLKVYLKIHGSDQ